MNHQLMSLVEAGLPDQWLNVLLPNMTNCGSISALKEAKTDEYVGGMRYCTTTGSCKDPDWLVLATNTAFLLFAGST